MTTYKTLLRLSLPMVVAQLSFSMMSFIDTLLMGKLGVEVLAGGGLGAMIYQFFYVVGIGVLVATANLIAFAKGENNRNEVQRALLSGVVVVLILFLVFSSIIWNASSILQAFGQAPETIVHAERYLHMVVWSLLPAFGFILLRSLALGLGDPSALLPISVVAAVLNYPLSFALMTGVWGLPAMGIKGIALGTCIISFAMLLGLALVMYRGERFKHYPFWAEWQMFSLAQLKATFALGIPIAIAHAMEIGLFSAAGLLIGLISVDALAAHHVALQCATLSFMIPLGISQAISVQVGESFGAGKIEQIKTITKSGLILVTISASIAGSVFWFAPQWLVSLFFEQQAGADYSKLLALAVSILFVAALFQLVDAWQVILMGVLRGFKLGSSPTVTAMVSYWLVGFPCSYWLATSWGAVGVWVGLGIGLATSALMLTVLYRKELNKQLSFSA